MTTLPDAPTLATLVSNVTNTMCGISFEPADPATPNAALLWRVAILPIDGHRPLRVALSSDQAGCVALGSALLWFSPDELDAATINDSLCELLNMAAGQIKSALALDQALGLPKIVAASELSPSAEAALRGGVLLRSQGTADLLIWISEGKEA
jgi:Chemotaxis phosphatase CheX